MKKLFRPGILLAIGTGALIYAACGDPKVVPTNPQGSGGTGGATASGGNTLSASGGTGGAGGDSTICDEQDITLQLAGVQAMLLLDRSAAMLGGQWSQATAAITTMMDDANNANTAFGLDTFPKGDTASDSCTLGGATPVELAANNQTAIKTWLADASNSPGGNTPLISAIESYMLDPTSTLHNSTTANYLIVISDGVDSCYDEQEGEGGSAAAPDDDFTESDALHMLAGAVHDLKDVAGIKTIAIGFGSAVSEGSGGGGGAGGGGGTSSPLVNQLNTIAKNGGSSFTTFINAADQTELETAFQEISNAIRPCRAVLESPDATASPSKVNFYADGSLIPRDLTNTDGWNWTKGDKLEVEFYGDSCTKIKDGTVSQVSASFGCPTKVGADSEVCANKDYFLPTPDVAVMQLLDFSGSMKDGASSTKWTDATAAITNSLVDDRNNGVEFGLDLFPDTAEGSENCEVLPYPNIPVGAYTTYNIIDKLAHLNPTGNTPLIQALSRYAYNPGRIGDADVSGSLVVIADGAAGCVSPMTDQEKLDELTTVTKAIVENFGIKVFAIGFGGVGTTAQAQLNAIATNGGTGRTAYSQADNQAQLETVFNKISGVVTSCIFDVPYAGSEVDYEKVNFYLDGVAVPRDTAHNDGWDWVNITIKDKVEFYGSWCTLLKEGTVSDVLVEFGCEQVVVK